MPFWVAFIGAFKAKIASLFTAKAIASAVAVAAVTTATTFVLRWLSTGDRDLNFPAARSLVRGAVVPARWVVGRARVAGVLHYWGAQHRTARMGVILSEGPCDRVEAVWIDGERVQMARTTASDGHHVLKPRFSQSKYYNNLTIHTYLAANGREGVEMRQSDPIPSNAEFYTDRGIWDDEHLQTAELYREGQTGTPTQVSTPFPAWTADHKMMGLSWAYIEMRQPNYETPEDRVYRAIPRIEFLVKGLKFTWPGQSSPAWTENAAAIRYWWETSRRARPAADIDGTAFTAAYTLCGETVDVSANLPADYAGYASTAPRYSINGVIEAGENLANVDREMDEAMSGSVVESGGKLLIRPGQARTPSVTITDADILAAPVLRPWHPLEERVNALDTTLHSSSEHDWLELKLPRYADSAARTRDGELRPRATTRRFVASPITGGRLDAILMRRLRASLTVSLTVRPRDDFALFDLKPDDVIRVESTASRLNAANYRIEQITITSDSAIQLDLSEETAGIYADSLVLPPLKSRNLARVSHAPTIEAPTGLTLDEIATIAKDGSTIVRLTASWATNPYSLTLVQRTTTPDASTVPDWSESEVVEVVGSRWSAVVPPTLGTVHHVRVRHGSRGDAVGAWATATRVLQGDLTPPGAVTGLTLTALPSGIKVHWTPPGDDDLLDTLVFLRSSGTLESEPVHTLATDADEAVLTGLQPTTDYHVWARARDRSKNLGALTSGLSVRTMAAADGEKGAKGEQGLKGPRGNQGGPGDKGDKGDKGFKGIRGNQGEPGAKGGVGDPGLQGIRGNQGEPGTKGGLGPTGGKGVAGAKGAQGPAGPGGQPGQPGTKGGPGPKGVSGAAGQPGQAGAPGTPGQAGTPGPKGERRYEFYTNAPEDTNRASLAPISRNSDGSWKTAAGFGWYPLASQVPDNAHVSQDHATQFAASLVLFPDNVSRETGGPCEVSWVVAHGSTNGAWLEITPPGASAARAVLDANDLPQGRRLYALAQQRTTWRLHVENAQGQVIEITKRLEATDEGLKGQKGEPGVGGGGPPGGGAKGEKGVPGAKGSVGVGIKGEKGVPGSKGATAAKGQKGGKGEYGNKGSKGDEGPRGDKGPEGPAGEHSTSGSVSNEITLRAGIEYIADFPGRLNPDNCEWITIFFQSGRNVLEDARFRHIAHSSLYTRQDIDGRRLEIRRLSSDQPSQIRILSEVDRTGWITLEGEGVGDYDGVKGQKGRKGEAGIKGIKGAANGPKGTKGEPGGPGATGIATKGAKGAKGDPGSGGGGGTPADGGDTNAVTATLQLNQWETLGWSNTAPVRPSTAAYIDLLWPAEGGYSIMVPMPALNGRVNAHFVLVTQAGAATHDLRIERNAAESIRLRTDSEWRETQTFRVILRTA